MEMKKPTPSSSVLSGQGQDSRPESGGPLDMGIATANGGLKGKMVRRPRLRNLSAASSVPEVFSPNGTGTTHGPDCSAGLLSEDDFSVFPEDVKADISPTGPAGVSGAIPGTTPDPGPDGSPVLSSFPPLLPELSLERADEMTRRLFLSLPLGAGDYAAMSRTFQKSRIRTAVMDFLWQRFRERWWHRPPVERCHLWESMKVLARQETPENAGWKRLGQHLFTVLTDPWEDNLSLLTLFARDTLDMEWDADARQHLWVAWSVRFAQLPCRGRTIAIRVLRELDRRFFPGALAAEMIDFYKTMVLTFPAIWWREATSYDPHLEDNLVMLMGEYLFENTWDVGHAADLEKIWLSCLRFARPEEQRIAGDVLRLIEEKRASVATSGAKATPLPARPGEHLRGPIPQDVILMSVYRQRF